MHVDCNVDLHIAVQSPYTFQSITFSETKSVGTRASIDWVYSPAYSSYNASCLQL